MSYLQGRAASTVTPPIKGRFAAIRTGRALRFVALASLAGIPLQWFALGSSPIGELRLHQLAMFAFTGCIIVYYGLAKVSEGTRRQQFFILANLYMLVISAAMVVYNKGIPIQQSQTLLYIISFAAVSAFFFMAANDPSYNMVDALRWSALVTSGVLILAFAASLLKNGINPLSVVQQTIATGDPSILTQQLFGQAFVGFGFDLDTTQVQIRHEVFGGLLLSMYVASWAKARRPFTEPRQLAWYRIAMVVGTLMVLVSLSRALTLAAVLWPAILFLRALLSGRISGGQLTAVLVTVVGSVGLAVTGFLEVIWDRFAEDTRGYEARSENITLALERIFDNFWTGGVVTEGTSSHNFILDNFQRGGVLVGIPTLVVFFYIFGVWMSLLVKIRTMPVELVPVSAALALPIFRMMTQGGGQISVNGWMTMAFVTGVVFAWRRREEAAQEEQKAAQLKSQLVARRPGSGGLMDPVKA